MESFIDYINSALPDQKGDSILYKYKRKVLEEMTQRANEVASRGINNCQVVDDLIISEYANLKEDYKEYYKKEKAAQNSKRNLIYNIIGSGIYLLLILVIYFGVSFATHAWNMTWAIIADGVLIWVVYLLMLGVKKFTSMKRIFHIFARMFLAGAVITWMTAVFLLIVAVTDIPHSWLIVIFGLITMFICDGLYATLAKHRLAILNWLIYIPVIAVFTFIIIGVLGFLPWGIAWIIIPVSLILDLVIILLAIGKNKLDKMEVADTWNEN